MDLYEMLARREPMERRPHMCSWRIDIGGRPHVARARRCDGVEDTERPDPFDVSMPQVAGVVCWEDFWLLDDEESQRLELDGGPWVVAIRPYVKGRPLAELVEQGPASWRDWGYRLALDLRGLHAQKWFHGHIDPTSVIIDTKGRPRVVGVPLIEGRSGEPSALKEPALMAPELWDGEPTDSAADVYAVSGLICWMASGGVYPFEADSKAQWAKAHRDLRPAIPDHLDDDVAAAIRRGMTKGPRARPSMQLLMEALVDAGARRTPGFVSLPASLYRGLERDVVAGLDEGAAAIVLKGQAGTGRTYALERILARLRLVGKRVVYRRPGRLLGPGPAQVQKTSPISDPWDPIRRLITIFRQDQRSRTRGPSKLLDVTGDQLFVFETWAERLRAALPAGETVVIWDDLDVTGPDLRRFWAYFVDHQHAASRESTAELRFVAATGGDDDWSGAATQIPVVGPDPTSWTGWRARTLMSEIRDIGSRRWEEITEESGRQPVVLFEAINREIGVEERPHFAARRPPSRVVPDVSVIFAGDWRRHLRGLMNSGAYTQVVDTCRRLFEVLARSGRKERVHIFKIWLDALGRIDATQQRFEELEQALIDCGAQTEGSGAAATLIRARLYNELGRHDHGLKILDELGPLRDEHEIERHRWQAQMHLSSGDFEAAHRSARRGRAIIDEVERDHGPARCHLTVVDCAARAMGGDRGAIDELGRFAPVLGDEDVDARLRARCHIYRAIGLTRCADLEAATDAYLRALEEVESAGLRGELPAYLLNVGTAYQRQSRLGLAREYFGRGSRLAHEGTNPSTRALLLANEAEIDIALGRPGEAARLVERAGELADAHRLGPIRTMCRALAGDVECARGRAGEALEIYTAALDVDGVGVHQRAQLLLKSAGACLEASRFGDVSELIDSGRRLIEEHGLSDLVDHHGILRARLQWTESKSLGTMAGIEMFRRHLQSAADAGDHGLVLSQSHHLWSRLGEEGLVELMREVAGVFHRSQDAVAMGLTRELRDRFFSRLVDIPKAEDIGDGGADDQAGDQGKSAGASRDGEPTWGVNELHHENARLVRENEELLERLEQRDQALARLRSQVVALSNELEREREQRHIEEEKQQSKRGRRPKARRQQVVDALGEADGDFDAAANALGVSKRTLYRYVNRYALDV